MLVVSCCDVQYLSSNVYIYIYAVSAVGALPFAVEVGTEAVAMLCSHCSHSLSMLALRVVNVAGAEVPLPGKNRRPTC